MLCASLASRHINDHISQQTTAEMDWCRVVGPRGLCRPLNQKQALPSVARSESPSRPWRPLAAILLVSRPAWKRSQTRKADPRKHKAGCIFILPHRSFGTLGRGPAEPRAPNQMVSGTLGSWVWGLGLGLQGSGFRVLQGLYSFYVTCPRKHCEGI